MPPIDILIQPFYDYLMQRRRALLTELDSIERILGLPRTSEMRKLVKQDTLLENMVE